MIETNKIVAEPDNSHSISVDNLMKHFTSKKALENVKAVDGVSFQVNDGEFFGLFLIVITPLFSPLLRIRPLSSFGTLTELLRTGRPRLGHSSKASQEIHSNLNRFD